jgi:hypothetical protein
MIRDRTCGKNGGLGEGGAGVAGSYRAGGGTGDWRTTFRPDIPSSARIYDYLLDGKDNYPADREAARELERFAPTIRQAAKWNRAFVGRVVRFLIREAGLVQLLDVGSGLPTVRNVHEVAIEANEAARVVYVDHDPVVLAHARSMLWNVPNATIIGHDMQDTEAILNDPALRRLLDLKQPTGILVVSMLHFVPDEDDPGGIVRRLLAAVPPGSYVALTHATADASRAVSEASIVYERATTRLHVRSKAAVADMVAGLEVVEPGVVWTPLWRPDPGDVLTADPSDSFYYAVVARKTA